MKNLMITSKKITLFSPDGTSNPYYFELGWKQLSNEASIIEMPDLENNGIHLDPIYLKIILLLYHGQIAKKLLLKLFLRLMKLFI